MHHNHLKSFNNIRGETQKLAFLFVFFLATLPLSFAYAQLGPGAESVSVELSSNFPKPGESITVNLLSYSGDLDRAKIFYSINGRTVSSGAGIKKFTFRMGALGTATTLGVVVEFQPAGRFEKTITFNPADVDILWQAADSYTPPFYRGKALPPRLSRIRVVAVPEMKTISGGRVKSDALVYQWKLDDKPQLEKSGLARNFMDFTLDYVSNDKTIFVNASSVNEAGLAAVNTAYFLTEEPEIIFYENRPTEGIVYENALGNTFPLKNEEVTLAAEPYFFSAVQKYKRYLSFVWSVGGNEVAGSVSDPSELTLKSPKDSSGESEISIQVKNDRKFLQQGRAGLTVSFGKQ